MSVEETSGTEPANNEEVNREPSNNQDNAALGILSYYEENKWGSVNDLSERSVVREYDIKECEKVVEKYIEYEDEEMIREIPVTQAERVDLDSEFSELHADDREEFIPSEFEEGIMDFARPETERVNPCSDCGGNGRLRCNRCSGSGQNQCSSCSGSGTNYDDTKRCSTCGGSGTQVCSNCSGNGSVACSTCEQKGETWKMDFVRREFTPQEEISANASGAPDEFVEEAEGRYRETEEKNPKSGEIRRETDFYDVDVERVDYVYDDKDYSLFRIEGEDVKANSYPKNQARKILPYAAAAAGIVILGLILWQTGTI